MSQQIEQEPLDGLLDRAIAIAEQRRVILRKMKAALEQGDTDGVLTYAKQLCGVIDNEKVH
jgi:hypothetical protein